MSDIVTATVDYDTWVKTDEGHTVPQSTADKRSRSMVDMLDVHPGVRVLEIGTGSGYSGAVLSRIVGDTGHVVSIDVDAALTERATALHAQAGHTNVEVHTADGFGGWPPAAPVDRIVGWATPHVLPASWVEQAAPEAVIVTPVKIADVACANALVRCTIDGGIRDGELHPGNFIEMAPGVITELAMPVRYVDAVHRSEGGAPWWISARLLHDQPREVATRLLTQIREAEPQAGFFTGGRDQWEAFNAFVLARTETPGSLGTANGWGIGVASIDGIAVVLPGGALVAAGTSQAHDELAGLFAEWHELGEPGHAILAPTFVANEDSWTVRATVRGERLAAKNLNT